MQNENKLTINLLKTFKNDKVILQEELNNCKSENIKLHENNEKFKK